MKSISLPTVNDEGYFIDPDRVKCAYIFVKDGVKYIHCFVNGELHFLIWTIELENWFLASGIGVPEFENIPVNGAIVSVSNVPSKYNKKLSP